MPSCSTVTEITNLPAFETMKSLSNSFVISQGHQSFGGLIFYLNLNLSKTAHIRDTRYLLPIIYEPDNEAFYISYWPIMKLSQIGFTDLTTTGYTLAAGSMHL